MIHSRALAFLESGLLPAIDIMTLLLAFDIFLISILDVVYRRLPFGALHNFQFPILLVVGLNVFRTKVHLSLRAYIHVK